VMRAFERRLFEAHREVTRDGDLDRAAHFFGLRPLDADVRALQDAAARVAPATAQAGRLRAVQRARQAARERRLADAGRTHHDDAVVQLAADDRAMQPSTGLDVAAHADEGRCGGGGRGGEHGAARVAHDGRARPRLAHRRRPDTMGGGSVALRRLEDRAMSKKQGLFSRLRQSTSSTLNDAVESMSDPGQEIALMLDDLAAQIQNSEKDLKQAVVDRKVLERKLEEQQKKAIDWEKRAEQALKVGE